MLCPVCGASNSDEEAFCCNCGRLSSASKASEAPTSVEPTWPGAAPRESDTPRAPSAYCEGDDLMVPRGAKLPAFCIRCGLPAGDEPVLQSFPSDIDWSEGSSPSDWGGWIIYIISPIFLAGTFIMAKMAKKAAEPSDERFSLFVPLCAVHRQRYERYRIAAWTLTLGAIPAAILVGFLAGGEGPGAALMALVTLAAAAAIVWRLARLLHPKGVDRSFAILTGACEEFLSRLRSERGSLTPI